MGTQSTWANDDGSDDLFVHASQIFCDGFRTLAKNEQVEFEIDDRGNGKSKLRAINVTGPGGAKCTGQIQKTIVKRETKRKLVAKTDDSESESTDVAQNAELSNLQDFVVSILRFAPNQKMLISAL